VGYGDDRNRDGVTPNGKYFIMLEEGTMGRLTKYVDMQDNYVKKWKVCLKYSYFMTFIIIFFNIILYLPTSSRAK
jgi:hypothetical protein